ncbi:Uncharacterised protein [Mycolicibacterium vanbaalenii]|uniref:Uncharacterized protein n=1 Tax=Mycolicibacterium vanbaalenii TaxID=110539 RepID=A0A5S9R860_MYCVN|nr:hypothetical protein [Mycolicibacterium vanbaalenii]CAA0134779.1 Uncharacterised protein [Mycolicibacterium vanbaalenii]
MVLKGFPARLAVARTHVLAVELPGQWPTRVALQRRVLARGWRMAVSPADADVLAVCGVPGPQMAAVIDLVWDQLPGPRVRTEVADGYAVDDVLDCAAAELLDTAAQVGDARSRPQRPDHGDMDHGDMDHGDMDHGDMAPSGVPLAGGADDRDGLEMDVLHLGLGPVLAHWPSGMRLRCVLSGDVVTEATVTLLDSDHHPAPAAPVAARQCDHLVDLLTLAGWPHLAKRARRCRDLLLDDPRDQHARDQFERLRRSVRRSRLLRWSLHGLAPLSPDQLAVARLPASLAGDTYDRLQTRIRVVGELLSNRPTVDRLHVDPAAVADALPGIVVGLDVAAVRLVIAGLGVDTTVAAQLGAP